MRLQLGVMDQTLESEISDLYIVTFYQSLLEQPIHWVIFYICQKPKVTVVKIKLLNMNELLIKNLHFNMASK